MPPRRRSIAAKKAAASKADGNISHSTPKNPVPAVKSEPPPQNSPPAVERPLEMPQISYSPEASAVEESSAPVNLLSDATPSSSGSKKKIVRKIVRCRTQKPQTDNVLDVKLESPLIKEETEGLTETVSIAANVVSASDGGSRKRVIRKIVRKVVPKTKPKGTPEILTSQKSADVVEASAPQVASAVKKTSADVPPVSHASAGVSSVPEVAAAVVGSASAPLGGSRKRIVRKIVRKKTPESKPVEVPMVAFDSLALAQCAAPMQEETVATEEVNYAPASDVAGTEPPGANPFISEPCAVALPLENSSQEPVQKKRVTRVRKVMKKKIVMKRVPKKQFSCSKTTNLPVQASTSLEKPDLQPDANGDAGSCHASPVPGAVDKVPKPESLEGTEIPSKHEKVESCDVKEAQVVLGKRSLEDAECDRGEEQGLSESKKRRRTEIYIGGLDRDAKEEDIRNVFRGAGEIVEVRMMLESQTGKNKGYAFLRYANAAQAKKAISDFQKVEVCGKVCKVSAIVGKDTIFLGNIEKKWKKEDIFKLLEEIGIEGIDTVNVVSNPVNAELNRGFAFLELKTNRDAHLAYKKLQKKDIFGKGRNVKVAWAEPFNEPDDADMEKVKSVFVAGVPQDWSEERMRKIFERFGDIDAIVFARNINSARRKDFAFVNFNTRKAALSCVDLFKLEEFNEVLGKVNLKVSLAKPVQKGKESKVSSNSVMKKNIKEYPKTAQSYVKTSGPSFKGEASKWHQKTYGGGDMFSSTRTLVEVFGHQPTAVQAQVDYPKGMPTSDYSQSSLLGKRPFGSMENNAHYPILGGRPLSDGGHSASSSSYAALPYGAVGSTLPYNQLGFGNSTAATIGRSAHNHAINIQRTGPYYGSGFHNRY